MNIDEPVDIKENTIYKIDNELLYILLTDQTTKKNILWATDMYESKGYGYSASSQMTVDRITGLYGQVIKPRILKSKKDQMIRSREKAEVFTPSWICNQQNNIADNNWFGRENVFNTPIKKTWKTNKKKIIFPENKNWIDYINSLRIEVTCGEAPYLVSRYDTVTGKIIPVMNRIGLLDRKLRIISENTNNEKEWKEYVIKAYKSIYGFEWQGDSLLIARENLLYTYIDYYIEKFHKDVSKDDLKEIAYIISWNIFQMDGLKYVIPNSCINEVKIDHTLFGDIELKTECEGCKKDSKNKHNGVYVKIMNWKTNRKIKFISLLNKRK